MESGSETYIINIQFQVPANPRIAFTVRRTEVEPASHVHFMSTFSSAKPIAIIWPEGRGLKQKWRSVCVSVCVCVSEMCSCAASPMLLRGCRRLRAMRPSNSAKHRPIFKLALQKYQCSLQFSSVLPVTSHKELSTQCLAWNRKR